MILFASGQEWLCLDRGCAARVSAFFVPQERATLLWAPEQGVTGVAALEGNSRHAAVLIERRLRSEGSVEGDVKVFVHHVCAFGQGYQALYTAAPLDEWQRLLAWVGRLRNHCLVFPCMSLLWSGLKDGEGAVFQHGTQLVFLGMVQGQIVHANTIAFGPDHEDTSLAARALGERVRREFAGLRIDASLQDRPVTWYSVSRDAVPGAGGSPADGGGQAFRAAFAESSGCEVISGDEPSQGATGAADGSSPLVYSGLRQLARNARPASALNPAGDRWRFMADRLLPACTVLCFVCAAALLATSVNWLLRSGRTTQAIGELALREAAIRSRLAASTGVALMPAGLDEQLAFLDAARRLQAGNDVAGLLRSLGASVSAEVRILGVRAEEPVKGKDGAPVALGFVVDGLLSDGSLDQDSVLLSSWVRAMRRQGYEMEAIDAKVPVGASASTRLFSYRVFPAVASSEVRP